MSQAALAGSVACTTSAISWQPAGRGIRIRCTSASEQADRPMENRTARLTVLIDPLKKKAFEELCASQDLTPSQVVRQLIRDYLESHGVSYASQPKGSSEQD